LFKIPHASDKNNKIFCDGRMILQHDLPMFFIDQYLKNEFVLTLLNL
jgi:hypothetical protein